MSEILKVWEPHDYQVAGIREILKHEACALFWRPGTGKTTTALTAGDELLMSGMYGSKVLIVAPLRVAEDTWVREAGKWAHTAHLRVGRVLGSLKERKAVLERLNDFYVVNVENLPWLVEYYGKAWPFQVVMIDEYSGFKNHDTKRVKSLRKVRKQIKKLVGLTGSPASNGYGGLYSMLGLLDGGKRLGSTLTQFRDSWMEPDARSRERVFSWKLRGGKKEEIDDAIRDICYSVPAGSLPAVTYNDIVVPLNDQERQAYEQMERDSLVFLQGQPVTAANAAALTNKLLQCSSGAIYDDAHKVHPIHTAKLDTLASVCEEAGAPVLVFYAYQHELERLQATLGAQVLKTSADIAKWNKGQIPVAAMHPASAYGLNLQDGGSTIVWFTLPWSLEQYEQANARLHRQGQTQPVVIHHLLVAGSLDYGVLDALARKDTTQKSLLAALTRRLV